MESQDITVLLVKKRRGLQADLNSNPVEEVEPFLKKDSLFVFFN